MTTGRWNFIREDCKLAGTCGCGFCSRDGECDYGDCHQAATTRCPRFHYPVCTQHATVNVPARGAT